MNKTVALAACANEAYAMPMTVALHSALKHLDPAWSADVYVMDAGIAEDTRARCETALATSGADFRLHWIIPDVAQFANVRVRRYSVAALLRLNLPAVCRPGTDRVLYIDSDVVVNDDISTLWGVEMSGNVLMAVANPPGDYFQRRVAEKMGLEAPASAPYFNTGVLLMNVPEWIGDMVTERTLDCLSTYSETLSFPDQDALNAVVVGRWAPLEHRWNDQTHRMRRGKDTLGIVHYTSRKPWDPDYTGPKKLLFLKAYASTGWDRPSTAAVFIVRSMMLHVFFRVQQKLFGTSRRDRGPRSAP